MSIGALKKYRLDLRVLRRQLFKKCGLDSMRISALKKYRLDRTSIT
jgi:hypothetical protein